MLTVKFLKIRLGAAPEVVRRNVAEDPFVSSQKYTLRVDIPTDEEFQSNESQDKNQFLESLRKIVADDRKLPKAERIDALKLGPAPTAEYFSALDRLSPRHVDLWAEDDTIDLQPIDNLHHPWVEIESAVIRGVIDGLQGVYQSAKGESETEYSTIFPECFTRITSLTLDRCGNFKFGDARNVPEQLTNLKITGAEGMSMFCNAVDNITGFSDRLKRLYLTSNRVIYEPGSADDFRAHLKQCSALTDLFLALGDPPAQDESKELPLAHRTMADIREEYYNSADDNPAENDVKLAFFIPQSVETLSFHCSTSNAMFLDLDYWIDFAPWDDWLPNLKSLTIKTDGPEVDVGGDDEVPEVPSDRLEAFQAKIDKLYTSVKNRTSGVTTGA